MQSPTGKTLVVIAACCSFAAGRAAIAGAASSGSSPSNTSSSSSSSSADERRDRPRETALRSWCVRMRAAATVWAMDRLPTWPIAAGSLLVGFGVAQATGIRPLGGIVLIVAAAWCGLRWRRSAGAARAVALLGVYFGAFVVSHVIADTLGAWPAVLLAAAVTGFAAWAVGDGGATRRTAAA